MKAIIGCGPQQNLLKFEKVIINHYHLSMQDICVSVKYIKANTKYIQILIVFADDFSVMKPKMKEYKHYSP